MRPTLHGSLPTWLPSPPSEWPLPLLRFDVTRWLVRHGLQFAHRVETVLGRDAKNLLRVLDALPDATSRAASWRARSCVVA